MRRALAFVAALSLAGCALPSTTTRVDAPGFSPLREAFAYFPATAPVVAVVATDPQDAGLRRAAGGGALAPLQRELVARGLSFEDVRPLLGEAAVVGLPLIDGAPLAVLTVRDESALAELVRERVAAGAARPAGRYQGAELYDEVGAAFAVRDRVLLLGRSTSELLAALDTRAGSGGFEAAQLNDALPDDEPPASFARAYVNLAAFVARAGAAARRVPLLRALGPAGIAVGATPAQLRAVAGTGTAGQGLVADDLPSFSVPGGVRPALPSNQVALAVGDFAGLLRAAERALRAALPVTALKVDALRARLRGAKVDLVPQLLAGPAVVSDGLLLRLLPERPGVLETAVEQAAERLRLRAAEGFYRLEGVAFGFVNGSFVAGRAKPERLRRLALQPAVPLSSPVLLRVPQLTRWLPRPVAMSIDGSIDGLTVRAVATLSRRPRP